MLPSSGIVASQVLCFGPVHRFSQRSRRATMPNLRGKPVAEVGLQLPSQSALASIWATESTLRALDLHRQPCQHRGCTWYLPVDRGSWTGEVVSPAEVAYLGSVGPLARTRMQRSKERPRPKRARTHLASHPTVLRRVMLAGTPYLCRYGPSDWMAWMHLNIRWYLARPFRCAVWI